MIQLFLPGSRTSILLKATTSSKWPVESITPSPGLRMGLCTAGVEMTKGKLAVGILMASGEPRRSLSFKKS